MPKVKVNATTRGRRICDTVKQILPEYDQACIVLRFSGNGVEASVHVAGDGEAKVGDELLTLNQESADITEALRVLEAELKARVREMAAIAGVELASPDTTDTVGEDS